MKPLAGWSAVSALLLETASRDLTGIGGAFWLSSTEWTVLCFVSGILAAVIAALVAPKF